MGAMLVHKPVIHTVPTLSRCPYPCRPARNQYDAVDSISLTHIFLFFFLCYQQCTLLAFHPENKLLECPKKQNKNEVSSLLQIFYDYIILKKYSTTIYIVL
jgi:hypothetical protein